MIGIVGRLAPVGARSVAALLLWCLALDGAADPAGAPLMADGEPVAQAGALLDTRPLARSEVASLAFSPDGKLVADAYGYSIRFWDLTRWTLVRTLDDPRGSIDALAFGPDGRTLASGSHTGRVLLWDLASGTPIKTLDPLADGESGQSFFTQSGGRSLAFSPDGRWLVYQRQHLLVWDTATGRRIGKLDNPEMAIAAIAFGPDGRTLTSVADDGMLRFWDPASGRLRELPRNRDLPNRGLHAVAFGPQGRTLASAQGDELSIRDLERGTPPRTLPTATLAEPVGYLRSLAFHPNGRLLVGGSAQGPLLVFDTLGAALVGTLDGHADSSWSLAFAPDGRTLASGDADGTLGLWDPLGLAPLARLQTGGRPVARVAFAPDGRTLTVTTLNHRQSIVIGDHGERLPEEAQPAIVYRWDVRGDRPLAMTERQWQLVVPDPVATEHECKPSGGEGRTSAPQAPPVAASTAAVARPDGKPLAGVRQGGAPKLRATSLSPDGHTLAGVAPDNTVSLWDPSDCSIVKTLAGRHAWISSLAFSPDGRTLAGGSDNGSVWLWDTASGRETGALLAAGELWIGCRLGGAQDRCWRHDDGTLTLLRDAQGWRHPLPLPKRQGPPRIEASAAGPDGQPLPLRVSEGQTARLRVRVRNLGSEPVYWLSATARDPARSPILLHALPRLARLDPQGAADLIVGVSYHPAFDDPVAEQTLDLTLEMDQSEPMALQVPVLGLLPGPAVVAGPESLADLHVLTLRLANRGAGDLEHAWVGARVSAASGDAGKTLDRVGLDRLAAGGEVPLSFGLPDGLKVAAGSHLTLEIEDRSRPGHRWRLKDLPIASGSLAPVRSP